MSGDERADDDSGREETPPDVLTPDELSLDDIRQLDETTQVVPLEDADAMGDTVSDLGTTFGDTQTTDTGTGADDAGFSATTQVGTPDGETTFEARSDDLDAFFDEFVLQLLETLAPDREPETALAVLLHSSSLSVTVHPDDE